jgi:hypothetical protein
MNENLSTFGIYKEKSGVKQAVKALKLTGFKAKDISVLNPDRPITSDLASQPGNQVTTGIVTGAILGAAAAIALEIAAVMVPIFRVHFTNVAAPIFGVLLGAALGAAMGALVGVGIPAAASSRYSRYLSKGGILVAVSTGTPESTERATKILEKTGALDINALNEESV